MYDPHSGPINAVVQPVLESVSNSAKKMPGNSGDVIEIILRVLAIAIAVLGFLWIRNRWRHEASDHAAHRKEQVLHAFWRLLTVAIGVSLLWMLAGAMPAAFANARAELNAPSWLTNYYWAKPAIMIMGFWAALGSNNMLLYLAGLSNIPEELKEAASIDGAGPVQRFWHVTWPQLAPITFFIIIMSVIGGLQGGFEMARAMTNGGPGGSTTTLSYFVYNEGFVTGRLGYASAIAWTLFLFVFLATLCNWKLGSRISND
jgi:ABC-type sugar transport system permease subunit